MNAVDQPQHRAAFRYSDIEIAAIRATLHSELHLWPDIQQLETEAALYLFRVARSRDSLSRRKIAEEKSERDRIVKRVQRSVPVSDRGARISSTVDDLLRENPHLSRTRLLAQAMFERKIDELDLEELIVREYLTHPDRLNWPGSDRWLFADDRKKAHRFQYINYLVCFWAEEQFVRPDEVPVSAAESSRGDRLMDFILAAASRPLQEAGEEIGADRILDLVQEVKEYWRGRPWEAELEMTDEEPELATKRAK